jgi:hypothetical protein
VGFSGFPSDVVLGGRISSGRERKSWKIEEEERKSLLVPVLAAHAWV